MAFFRRMREAWCDALLDYNAQRVLRFKRMAGGYSIGGRSSAEIDARWREMNRTDVRQWWEHPLYWVVYFGQFFNVNRRLRERQELVSILRQRELSLALMAHRHDYE